MNAGESNGLDQQCVSGALADESKIQNPKSKIPQVLVVDDEAHIVQVLMLKLRNAGYSVLTAGDGEEALEVALQQSPDLIITDFQMPYMTGLELCRALAQNEKTASTPVMMLTARGYALDPEDLAIGRRPGQPPMIRCVVNKPFSPRGIVEQIQTILGEGFTAELTERAEMSYSTSSSASSVSSVVNQVLPYTGEAA